MRDACPSDLYEAVVEGSVERVHPKMMTVTAIMAGLLWKEQLVQRALSQEAV